MAIVQIALEIARGCILALEIAGSWGAPPKSLVPSMTLLRLTVTTCCDCTSSLAICIVSPIDSIKFTIDVNVN